MGAGIAGGRSAERHGPQAAERHGKMGLPVDIFGGVYFLLSPRVSSPTRNFLSQEVEVYIMSKKWEVHNDI